MTKTSPISTDGDKSRSPTALQIWRAARNRCIRDAARSDCPVEVLAIGHDLDPWTVRRIIKSKPKERPNASHPE